MATIQAAHEQLCAACRRINDKFPAGIRCHGDLYLRNGVGELMHQMRAQPAGLCEGVEQ